uniref:Peptidase S1 domain-containing protein n=1 Tax=Labrus bergylta TaxID=56723 RepID=A0A3Q3GLW7_9LABR
TIGQSGAATHFYAESAPQQLGTLSLAQGHVSKSREVVHVQCNNPTPNSLLTKDRMCLLELSHPVNFTDFIFPVCVAAGDSTIHSGTESWVATGSHLEALVKVSVVGYNECKCSHPKLKEHMICAGDTEEHFPMMDSSLDNLGGALVVDFKGYWTMIGVVSLEPNCHPLKSLKSYSNVAPCADFLTNATASNPPGFAPIQCAGTDPDSRFICPAPGHPESFMPPRPLPHCPQGCQLEDFDKDSIFGGVNVMRFSPFLLLSVLILSIYGTKW